VAALWLSMTFHCQLESVPGFEFLKCDSEQTPDETKSPCTDNCCSVEHSVYKSEMVRQTVPLPDLLPLWFSLSLPADDELTANAGAKAPDPSPPELSKRWQFVFRTASPPRAPSLAS
jgi:hypothetical protein